MKRSQTEINKISKRYKKMGQIEHCHERPDMYVGNTRPERIETFLPDLKTFKFKSEIVHFSPAVGKIADEVLVNAFDNIQRKGSYTRRIDVSYNMDTGRITVKNDGTTVPVVMHTEHNMYVPTMVFGHILTGENYDDKKQRLGGGRNGWGAKLTNIFSSEFTIRCVDAKNGLELTQKWENNMGTTAGPRVVKTQLKRDVTEVSFIPEWSRFKMQKMNRAYVKYITKRALEMAACSPKDVKVTLNGNDLPVTNLGDYTALYTDKPITYLKVSKRWEVALFPTDEAVPMPSFVNGICTSRGGKHVDHAMGSVYKKLAEVATKKVKGIKVRPKDVSTFTNAIVSAFIVNPAFDSQTKETLKTPVAEFGSKCEWKPAHIKKITKSGILERVEAWAIAKAGKSLQKKIKAKSKLGIPKLYDANKAGTRPDESAKCTIILTEGDSALTTALSGLEIIGRTYYGAFPCKGKLLNVRDASIKSLMENAEIQNICKILGLVPGVQPNPALMRYGHIMIMTDQDHDGSHIKGLIINMIHAFWPSLLKVPGFVQIFKTPIVKVKHRQQEWVFYTMETYHQAMQQPPWPQAAKHKHYKGLGTSTPAEAKEYFRHMDKHVINMMWTDTDNDSIDMAFRKTRANDRRNWLSNMAPDAGYVDATNYTDFVNKELILFSQADNARSLPSIWDGLKESQRKVLWSAFKRNLTSEIRVAQLAGYVSEHAAYHHGEASLNGTIIGLAQDFVGSNNCALLYPAGQFGSRLQGGGDAASPRYVHTHLQPYTRDIFMKEDDVLLPSQIEDSSPIEPLYYAPIIPLVFVNGSTGIGTGYRCNWPQHNPVDLIDFLLGQLSELKPWYKGFGGTVGYDADLRNVVTRGRYTKRGNTITITELPVGVWTQKYSEWLHKQSWITKIVEKSTPDKVHFEVNCSVADKDVISKLKLENKRPVNLVGFDTDNKLKVYKRTKDVLDEWIPKRINMYEKRRLAVINYCNQQINLNENKCRFIQAVIQGNIKPHLYKKTQLESLLHNQGYTEINELLNIKIYNMTSDEITKLKALLSGWQTKKEEYVKLSAKELWYRDLRTLKSKLV